VFLCLFAECKTTGFATESQIQSDIISLGTFPGEPNWNVRKVFELRNPPDVSQSSEVVAFNKYQRASGVFLSLFTLLWIRVFAALGCSGSASNTVSSSGLPPTEQVVAPVFTITPEQNGAVLITLSDSAANANIYYSLDGSTPTSASPQYIAPFLVASNTTVQAIGIHGGETNSPVSNKTFSPNIASGTLVWSEEFDNTTGANAQPNPAVWTYDTGAGGWGNGELENYCAWGSSTVPCNSTKPNEYVGTDGYLHIVAQQPSAGVYTSSRLKTHGLFSFQYGRLEFRAQVPEAQGFWPAAWLMGNNIQTVNWPACGEQDVMERVNAATTPDINVGSIHGPGFTGSSLGTNFYFPNGVTAATWHTYGMIWKPGSVSYYVDDPTKPYVTYTSSSLAGLNGASWPFDGGQASFIILNLAVGGQYPGSPNTSTPFPSEALVDYVRLYTC